MGGESLRRSPELYRGLPILFADPNRSRCTLSRAIQPLWDLADRVEGTRMLLVSLSGSLPPGLPHTYYAEYVAADTCLRPWASSVSPARCTPSTPGGVIAAKARRRDSIPNGSAFSWTLFLASSLSPLMHAVYSRQPDCQGQASLL